MTERDDLRVEKALQGADFPADRATLVNYAQTRGVDSKSLQALQTIPEQIYTSSQHVIDAVAQEPEGQERPGGTAR